MSDIIKARENIEDVLEHGKIDARSRRTLRRALALMYREPAIRRATARRVVIDLIKRREVRRLAATTDMTAHQIADAVGLRNSGRVSDVLHGRR